MNSLKDNKPMSGSKPNTVADIEGPWVDPGIDSSLVSRCKHGWNVPIIDLTNELLATYLRQKIALSLLVPEAERRIAQGFIDDTEMYDGEIECALKAARDIN